jgi:hypothetical protein
MTRVAYRDETWRLALAGDAATLRDAARLLDDSYDGARMRAFADATEGRIAEALDALNEGWTEDWPFPRAYLVDVARIRFLGGDCAGAVEALALAAHGADGADPAVRELVAACVRRGAPLWPALSVALAVGSARQRAGAAVAVLRARAGAQRGAAL